MQRDEGLKSSPIKKKYFEAEVKFWGCPHVTRVYLCAFAQPRPGEKFTAHCPIDNGRTFVLGSQFREVERCPEGACDFDLTQPRRKRIPYA